MNWRGINLKNKELRICMVGAGFVGMKHAAVYSALYNTKMQIACDSNIINATKMAERFRFQKVETDWRKAVSDDNVDIVCICVPNHMHFDIAKEALLAGKYVVCEKPLGMNSKESTTLSLLAKEKGIKTSCCYNLVYTPAIQYIKSIVKNGELGELVCFRGAYDNDRLANPNSAYEWRMNKKISKGGAICDLGLNIIAVSQYLFGDTKCVSAMTSVIHKKRVDNNGNECDVENDDIAQFIFEYKNKGIGYISCNRVAPGSKQDMKFEVQFTEGAIRYSLERMNELHIFRNKNCGYETVISDNNGWFNVGYEDLKGIDAENFLFGISNGEGVEIDFSFATKIYRIIEAVLNASEKKTWIEVSNEKEWKI